MDATSTLFAGVSLAPRFDDAPLPIGQTVERYCIEEVVARSAVATVYRVVHATLGSTHALKVLHTRSPAVRERMLDAGRRQAQLRHLNLVAVTDVVVVDHAPGLVLEMVSGPRLDQWLSDHQPDIDEALRIFRAITRGTAEAHKTGLLHRDLNPANILMADLDGTLVPKVTAFSLTPEGSAGGRRLRTPRYTAPEQFRDARRVDQRADLFSLGCILYELVCGEPAFPGDDRFEVIDAVISGRYRDLAERCPDLPSFVPRLVRALLEVRPDHRPPNATAVLEILAREVPGLLTRGSQEQQATAPRPQRTVEPPAPVVVGIPRWLKAALLLFLMLNCAGAVTFFWAALTLPQANPVQAPATP